MGPLKFIRILLFLFALALVVVIGYSGTQLWGIHQNNAQEAEMHNRLLRYRPVRQMAVSAEDSDDATVNTESGPHVNQSIADLQAIYPDAIGWLTVPNTQIDYPFVQGVDNDTYLHLDLDQRWAAAGTIFLDYRNGRDFTDFNTILYGHHMRNGSMFGTLQQFSEQAFFDANPVGTLFLVDKTYEIEFIAFAVIAPNDSVIYAPAITEDADRVAFLDHVRRIARHYRDINATADERIVTLSTCNYEFNDARMVLIGRLVEV